MYVVRDRLSAVLEEYVGLDGKVDYVSLGRDNEVDNYVESLKSLDPEELTEKERIAFWINTYNLLTIKGILNRLRGGYDFESKGNARLIHRLKFFVLEKYCISGKMYSLYRIEKKMRKEFQEPRVHFALNCASSSCPLLKDGLYSGEHMDHELNAATTLFIRGPSGARLDRKRGVLYLSKVFKWYKKDFKKQSKDIVQFVKDYMTDEDRIFIEENETSLRIRYQDYDWSLND